ncbi:hypothetical protein NMG60_11006732 [Bertholletia excelsa]
MGKKKVKEGEEEKKEKEGGNLLGLPTFQELENGRLKCVETGHELPAHAKDSYSQSKHCRLGLIDAALARNKPPLNMFRQDLLSRSKLICKLTGVTINKSEEHIWKHINGRRFLNMLEKRENEKQTAGETIEQHGKDTPESTSKPKKDVPKKSRKKQEKNIREVVTEVRNPSDKDSDSEETDFWMPPVGERWDYDDGGDRWDSGKESELETDDADEAEIGSSSKTLRIFLSPDVATEDSKEDAKDLSKRTKRMSIEIGPSSFASRKKKNKTKPT